MTKEFLSSLGIEKDAMGKIIWQHSVSLEKEKEKHGTLEANIESANQTIKTYETKLKAFEGVDVSDLKNQIQTLQNDIKTKEESVKKEQEDAKLTATILESLKGKEFVNDFTKNSIISNVKEEINKAENKGKGIGELLETLIKDTDNIFKNENAVLQMPNMGNTCSAGATTPFVFDFTPIHKNSEK
ncbi:MAG: phage scaffolding protein [Oscillospiraceae bacterium]